MARQIIDVGQAPDDKTGDPVRTAFQKTNDNFEELYSADPTTGWVNIQDTTYTVGSPFAVSAGIRTKLPLNADVVEETYSPEALPASTFYNPTTKKLYGANNGDSFMLRLIFTAKPSVSNATLDYEIDIGGTIGDIYKHTFTFSKGSNAQSFSKTDLIFTLDTFNANGGEIYVTPNVNMTIYDMSLVITRVHKGITIL